MRTTVRFRSYYSPNKFVCHPELYRNKFLLYTEQDIIILRTTYYYSQQIYTSSQTNKYLYVLNKLYELPE
jgi:hypothetical protein